MENDRTDDALTHDLADGANLRSQLARLQQENTQLKQQLHDLETTLEITTDHNSAIEAQLQAANQRLQIEVAERRQAEASLELLTIAISLRNLDLEILLETLRDHGDAIHDQWQAKVKVATDLAGIDSLTQIANRRRCDEYLECQWQQMTRSQSPLSVILADIDYFKQYNDTYGHLVGDDCLRHIAQSLRSTLSRAEHLVARFGGEEFVIILPQTTLEEAIALAQTFHHCVQQLQIPHTHSPISNYVTLSLGVACQVPHVQMRPQRLLNAADQALYAAKQAGRNQIASAGLILPDW
ncbi:MAG: GGDEF domain-containing protein [Cyanobacteria bacterium J069]